MEVISFTNKNQYSALQKDEEHYYAYAGKQLRFSKDIKAIVTYFEMWRTCEKPNVIWIRLSSLDLVSLHAQNIIYTFKTRGKGTP